jgi:hypothetical protein
VSRLSYADGPDFFAVFFGFFVVFAANIVTRLRLLRFILRLRLSPE